MQRSSAGLKIQSGFTLVYVCMFITILTSIAALSTWMVFQIQNNRIQKQISRLEQQAGELESRSKRLIEYDSNLKTMLGVDDNTELTPETVQQLHNDTLEELEGLNNAEGPSSDVLWQLESQIRRLARHQRNLSRQNSDLQQNLSHQEQRLQSYQSVYDSRRETLNTYTTTLDTSLEQLNQDIQSAQQNGSDRVSAVEEEISSLEEEHSTQMEEMDLKLNRIQNNIGQLKPQPQAQYIEPDEVDGKVIRTGSSSNWVYINLGSDDRVQAGYQFGVYGSSGENDRELVGKIQVKQVFPDYARCSVISQKRVDRPILTEDRIDNPFFSPDGPKQIALIGEFQNQSEIESAITAIGSTVRNDLGSDVDFAITGSGAEETDRFNKAKRLGILLMNVENIRGFIQ